MGEVGIMTTLVKTKVICTGSKTCNMTECEHYHEHEWTPACEGGCFDGGVCVEATPQNTGRNIRKETRQQNTVNK